MMMNVSCSNTHSSVLYFVQQLKTARELAHLPAIIVKTLPCLIAHQQVAMAGAFKEVEGVSCGTNGFLEGLTIHKPFGVGS